MWGQLLDSQVPLKPGEEHCVFCAGYGALPVDRQDPYCSHFGPERCDHCEGSGKSPKDRAKWLQAQA
jgi:DnaJ-class molecular chaperone